MRVLRMLVAVFVLALFTVFFCIQVDAETEEAELQYFHISHEGIDLLFPYYSSEDINRENKNITRILVYVHGILYEPLNYLASGKMAAAELNEVETTLVIAPYFMQKDHLPSSIENSLLFWEEYPFWGSDRGLKGQAQEPIEMSAYEVLDRFFWYLTDNQFYPNLDTIVLAGNSAGGQLVNRYAASNRFDLPDVKPSNISMRYIVMAPSSYLYFNEERPLNDSLTVFTVPEDPAPFYNSYGFGLDNLYPWVNVSGVERILEWYPKRTVYYLVGSLDNDPHCPTFGTSPATMLQGPERLSRSIAYYNYLGHFFGNDIYNWHHHSVVSNIGHSLGLILSEEGLKAISEITPPPPPYTYNLGMATNPTTGGTATDLTGINPYEAGGTVNIKAEASEDYEFKSWSAPAGTFANANAAETTFTMPAHNVTVTANFTRVVKLGDVSGNGTTDVTDVVLVMRFSLALETPTEKQKAAADVNGDGVINVNDVVLITRYALGLIDSF